MLIQETAKQQLIYSIFVKTISHSWTAKLAKTKDRWERERPVGLAKYNCAVTLNWVTYNLSHESLAGRSQHILGSCRAVQTNARTLAFLAMCDLTSEWMGDF